MKLMKDIAYAIQRIERGHGYSCLCFIFETL